MTKLSTLEDFNKSLSALGLEARVPSLTKGSAEPQGHTHSQRREAASLTLRRETLTVSVQHHMDVLAREMRQEKEIKCTQTGKKKQNYLFRQNKS